MDTNLRKLRKATGLTMKQFGGIIGVSESMVSLYETGRNEPDLSLLVKMADYFCVTLDELVGYHAKFKTEKKPVASSDERDVKILELFSQLSDRNSQRVLDYVADILVAQEARPSAGRSSD